MTTRAFQKIYTKIENITKATVTLRAEGVGNDELATVGGKLAQVVKIMGDQVTLQDFAGTEGITTDSEVIFHGEPPKLRGSDNLAGRFFNAYGEPIEGGEQIEGEAREIGGPTVNPFRRIQPSELGPASIMQQPMRSVSVYRQMQNRSYEQTGDAFRVLSLSADGGVTYQPVLQLGVCAGSSMQEAAVQALRAMLAESFQKTIADAFPVSTAVLQAQLQQEIDAQKTYQQTAIREEGRVDVGEAGTQTFLFDEAVAADLMYVLEHVDCRACRHQELLTIILAAADAFFQGRKTAQEAARIMDSRAALFIAENS